MNNLPETRNAIFVEITPAKLLQQIGVRQFYIQAEKKDFESFDVTDPIINTAINEVTFRKSGLPLKVCGVPNVPVQLSNETIKTNILNARLVYIC